MKKKITQKKKTKTKQSADSKQSPADAAFDEYKPYISEMRHAFWRALLLFAFGAIVGMLYYKQILSWIMGFFKLENINIVLSSPYQFIDLSINSGFFIGVVFATPLFLYYLLKFTKPALSEKEYRLLVSMVPASVILFLIGFTFGVWVLQYVVNHFSQTSNSMDVANIWDLSSFISQVIIMGLSLAFIFQMPIVLTSLIRLNMVKHSAIQKQRRPAYAAILIFAALMPPTDMVALLILALVPLFLFEITLFLNNVYS